MGLLENTDFENCTKCTICTEYCPVSANNSLFPGPKQAGPDGERLRLKDASFYDTALTYCANCKRCEVACPSGVKIGDIIQLAAERYGRRAFSPRNFILSHTDVMGGLSTPLAPLVNAITAAPVVKKILDGALGIPRQRRLPSYAFGTFRRWFERKAEARQARFPRQAALFHGCYINYNNPDLGKDVVAALNALGVGVRLLPQEQCCGVPLIANKFFDAARRNAEINKASLRDAIERRRLPVVVPSSTCAMTLRDEYPNILGVDTRPLKGKIDLASRFLHRLLEEGQTVSLKPLKLRVAYHTACHIERTGWAAYSIDLLKRIPGLEVILLESRCCGIAGTYGFKKENYQTSQEIGAELFRRIEESGADLVVCDCETCKWQIEMSTTKKCEHPLTIFARALANDAIL
jgi:glycerol-3-phosphate dehydrogenase subunit C